MAETPKDDCIPWWGRVSSEGYGRVGKLYAHRLIFEETLGEIPEGYHIDHLCRNRNCVNPNHLEAVTQKENILRGNGACAHHAKKTHCVRGHKFDGTRRTPYGIGRTCSRCMRITRTRREGRSRRG